MKRIRVRLDTPLFESNHVHDHDHEDDDLMCDYLHVDYDVMANGDVVHSCTDGFRE